MLPFAVRFAVVVDSALHGVAEVVGPEYVTLGLSPITWFGILMAIAMMVHELATSTVKFWRRWRKQRSEVVP